jgi:predicted nucleic acid-binding protein
MGDSSASKVKELLQELRADKVRIYTSIIAVQEVSVRSYQKGAIAQDNYSKIDKLARIEGITKDIALTAAKFEAYIIDQTAVKDREDNKRRKWDCFHIATALTIGCGNFYTCDEKQLKRKQQFGITAMNFLRPIPSRPTLPFAPQSSLPAPPIQ